jgi:hypothetical protein
MADVLLTEEEAARVYLAEFSAFCRVADNIKDAHISDAQAHAAGQVARAQLARVVAVLDAMVAEAEAELAEARSDAAKLREVPPWKRNSDDMVESDARTYAARGMLAGLRAARDAVRDGEKEER